MKQRFLTHESLNASARIGVLGCCLLCLSAALHGQSDEDSDGNSSEKTEESQPAPAEQPVAETAAPAGEEPPPSQPMEDGSARPIPLLIPFDTPLPDDGTLPEDGIFPGDAAETDPDATEFENEQASELLDQQATATVSEADAFFTTFASGAMTSTAAGFPDRSYGFSGMPPGVPMGGTFADGALRGLSISASLTGTYDSNPSQGYGAAGQSSDGDFSLSLGGNMAYRSTAARWTFGANYSGNYNQYLRESDYGGYNQRAGAALYYDGGNLTGSLSLGLNFGSGANRYYQAVVDELSFSCNLSGNYKLGSKASLNAYVSQNLTSASGGNSRDTDAFSCGLTGFWEYSPRLSFGPGVRCTLSDGQYRGGRTTIGPTLNANYSLTQKVSIRSSVGADFVNYENAPDPGSNWSGFLSANYQISDLWGMNLSWSRGVNANPTSLGGFDVTNSVRVGFNRSIRRASWSCGMAYETQESEISNSSRNRTFWSFDTSLGMPVFADQVMASVFFRLRDDGRAYAGRDTESVSVGFSLNYSF